MDVTVSMLKTFKVAKGYKINDYVLSQDVFCRIEESAGDLISRDSHVYSCSIYDNLNTPLFEHNMFGISIREAVIAAFESFVEESIRAKDVINNSRSNLQDILETSNKDKAKFTLQLYERNQELLEDFISMYGSEDAVRALANITIFKE